MLLGVIVVDSKRLQHWHRLTPSLHEVVCCITLSFQVGCHALSNCEVLDSNRETEVGHLCQSVAAHVLVVMQADAGTSWVNMAGIHLTT
jgi:hypothetical protein